MQLQLNQSNTKICYASIIVLISTLPQGNFSVPVTFLFIKAFAPNINRVSNIKHFIRYTDSFLYFHVNYHTMHNIQSSTFLLNSLVSFHHLIKKIDKKLNPYFLCHLDQHLILSPNGALCAPGNLYKYRTINVYSTSETVRPSGLYEKQYHLKIDRNRFVTKMWLFDVTNVFQLNATILVLKLDLAGGAGWGVFRDILRERLSIFHRYVSGGAHIMHMEYCGHLPAFSSLLNFRPVAIESSLALAESKEFKVHIIYQISDNHVLSQHWVINDCAKQFLNKIEGKEVSLLYDYGSQPPSWWLQLSFYKITVKKFCFIELYERRLHNQRGERQVRVYDGSDISGSNLLLERDNYMKTSSFHAMVIVSCVDVNWDCRLRQVILLHKVVVQYFFPP